jgi:hypothetical protein
MRHAVELKPAYRGAIMNLITDDRTQYCRTGVAELHLLPSLPNEGVNTLSQMILAKIIP